MESVLLQPHEYGASLFSALVSLTQTCASNHANLEVSICWHMISNNNKNGETSMLHKHAFSEGWVTKCSVLNNLCTSASKYGCILKLSNCEVTSLERYLYSNCSKISSKGNITHLKKVNFLDLITRAFVIWVRNDASVHKGEFSQTIDGPSERLVKISLGSLSFSINTIWVRKSY